MKYAHLITAINKQFFVADNRLFSTKRKLTA